MRIRYSTAMNGRPVKKAYVYTEAEHGIPRKDVDTDAIHIVERLKAAGHETYIVGGAVRDLMLRKRPKDFDIVTDATPSRIRRVFRNSRIIGRRFRLVHVYFGPKIFEVCTYRSLRDGHTGNTYGSIEEDVLRRDFTMNALFYDPLEGLVVDYVNGVSDIRAQRIRPIIPLRVIFKDDPVRMIRAAKYSATTGFRLPLSLVWKIKREAELLTPVSSSRLTEELFKIIHSGKSQAIVEKLHSLGLFKYIQPRAAELLDGDRAFMKGYLQSLANLDSLVSKGEEERSGRFISFLIRDYLERIVDWSCEASEINELYRVSFGEVRQFVLPINPPRIELEKGIRLIFHEHGILIKKNRGYDKNRTKTEPKLYEGTKTEKKSQDQSGTATPMKKRRRRRHKKKNGGEESVFSTEETHS